MCIVLLDVRIAPPTTDVIALASGVTLKERAPRPCQPPPGVRSVRDRPHAGSLWRYARGLLATRAVGIGCSARLAGGHSAARSPVSPRSSRRKEIVRRVDDLANPAMKQCGVPLTPLARTGREVAENSLIELRAVDDPHAADRCRSRAGASEFQDRVRVEAESTVGDPSADRLVQGPRALLAIRGLDRTRRQQRVRARIDRGEVA